MQTLRITVEDGYSMSEVGHACNSNTVKLRQEDHQFKVNLGFLDSVLKNGKGWLCGSEEERLPML